MMLGMDVQDLALLLNYYESEKKRSESGQPSSLFDWLGEEKRKAKVYYAHPQGSGGHSGVPTQGNSHYANKRSNSGLNHLID